jgi:hypothetical protein
MRRTWVVILAAAAAIWLPYAINEPVADALPCGQNACVWKDANGGGCVFEWDGTNIQNLRDTRFQNCPDVSLDDAISSFAVNSAETAWLVFWTNPNQKGDHFCVPPRSSGNVPGKFNDKFSSMTMWVASSTTSKPVACQ